MSQISVNRSFILISVLTVMVQYYEYHLYGFMAAKIANVFFPSGDTILQILKTYFVMTIAFIAKPLGALYFGKHGDKYGRSNSFRMSVMACALASLTLFILPGYEESGATAIIILIICRMVICAAASAGSDGVRIFVFENVPVNKRCMGSAITTIFTQIGSLIAALSAWYFMQEEQSDAFWRMPFLIGALMGMSVVTASLIVNLHDEDSKLTQKSESLAERDFSYYDLISQNKRLFALLVVIIGCVGSTNQFLLIFFSTYNFEILKIINRNEMQLYLVAGIGVYILFAIMAGYISDRYNKVRIILNACVSLIFLMVLQAYSISNGNLNIGIFLMSIAAMPFIHMPMSVILKSCAPKEVRYRVFSLAHAVGSVLISAPTSFIATLLYSVSEVSYIPILYFIFSIVVMASCLIKIVQISYHMPIIKQTIEIT